MTADPAKQYFYFTRTAPAPTFGKYLVAGVIEAADEDAAIANLDAALKAAKNRDDAQRFKVVALDRLSRADPHGIVSITMAEED